MTKKHFLSSSIVLKAVQAVLICRVLFWGVGGGLRRTVLHCIGFIFCLMVSIVLIVNIGGLGLNRTQAKAGSFQGKVLFRIFLEDSIIM